MFKDDPLARDVFSGETRLADDAFQPKIDPVREVYKQLMDAVAEAATPRRAKTAPVPRKNT